MSRSPYVILVNGPSTKMPFRNLGLDIITCQETFFHDPEAAALVVFTGGADVSPSLYGKTRHESTYCSSARDEEEKQIFELALAFGIPMVGICRGAQFLCVMAGGKLVQDVSGHRMGDHEIYAKYPDGSEQVLMTTGDHHQMQYPWEMDPSAFEVLAYGVNNRSTHYTLDASTTVPACEASSELLSEPDVIWYPKINALGVQFHPEWMSENSPAVSYVRKLINHYFFSERLRAA